jgi:hypothetical protein
MCSTDASVCCSDTGMSLDSSQTRTKSLSAMFSARWGSVPHNSSFCQYHLEYHFIAMAFPTEK